MVSEFPELKDLNPHTVIILATLAHLTFQLIPTGAV